MNYDTSSRRPEQLAANIERTRSDIDATLTAIEHKLSPGQLLDEGLEYYRRSGAHEFTANLRQSVKQNPLPVALVGIGLAWLMAGGRNARPRESRHESRYDEEGDDAGDMLDDAESTVDRMSDTVGDTTRRATDAVHSVKDLVRDAVHRTSRAASSTKQSLSEAANSARQQAARVGERARRRYAGARRGYDTMLHEQPLALGAVGVAIGALIAAALPRTRQEDRLMGRTRDRLAEEAVDVGRQQMERTKDVAGAAFDAAKQEVARDTSQPVDVASADAEHLAAAASEAPATSPGTPGEREVPRLPP